MISSKICEAFDITIEKAMEFNIPLLPVLPENFGVLLIVGASGSGKTSILKRDFGSYMKSYQWDTRVICEHFIDKDDAINRLGAVGLNSIPSWLKPYGILSNGEQFRADLAIRLSSNTAIDEFTSVVDRNVAKSTCVSVRKYIDNNKLQNVVFSSCHFDIIEWLQPDLVFNVDTKELIPRSLLRQRPKIKLDVLECSREYKSTVWEVFKSHHYLSDTFNKSCRMFLCYWDGKLVGMSSSLAQPSGSLKNAFREHRTVILPDYQGMGFGVKLSNCCAQIHLDEGKRYFSRTTHFRLGEHREKSKLWRPTSKNKKLRTDIANRKGPLYNGYAGDSKRICYSHEYMGEISVNK